MSDSDDSTDFTFTMVEPGELNELLEDGFHVVDPFEELMSAFA